MMMLNYLLGLSWDCFEIFYNYKKVKLCGKICIQTLKDKSLIEYLDCPICTTEVQNESVLCQKCQHWVCAPCANVNKKQLAALSSPAYGDWTCLKCHNNNGHTNIDTMVDCQMKANELNEEYKTYTDCRICSKEVKGASLCCAICNFWVHRKCIGKFSLKGINSFESMNKFYKDKDWFCLQCSKDMFPFVGLLDDEFLLACLETFNYISPNIRKICQTLIDLNVLNDADNGDFKFDDKSLLEGIDPDKNPIFATDSEYLFDINDLKVHQEPEISVMNFNIRSIRAHFESFTNILNNVSVNFDIITLTETWLDANSNIDEFEIEGYLKPIVQVKLS